MEASRPVVWIPTTEVQAGDRLALLLSDAEAYPEVTGWSDRVLELSRHGLADVTHRTFTVTGAPWWADRMDRTGDVTGQTLIVARDGTPGPRMLDTV